MRYLAGNRDSPKEGKESDKEKFCTVFRVKFEGRSYIMILEHLHLDTTLGYLL